MDDAVVVGIDSLEGEPGLVAIEAAVQQLGEGAEGEVAVVHGLVVDPHLPAHEGLALRGKGRGIGQDVLLVRIGGDHVASTDDVLVLVHELEVDDAVVVGKDGLEGQPGLILVEVLAVLLHECIERIVGELALIHGGIPKTHLPAHKGLALGGEAGGSRGLKLDAGGGGDDIAAAQGHVLAVHIVHKGHMDGVVHSALTVQADHEGIRDNPLDVVVIQHNGHGGAVHTGVSLRIGVIRRHIGGGIELDVVVITLDAQTVARHRVAAIQQAGGDGLVALGGAVHLQVPQKGLQLGIRGGDSADGDRDNIVINHQVALFRQLITLGDPAGINVGGAHVVGVGSHSHGVAVAHLLTGHLVHEADRDVSRDALKDRRDGNAALGTIPVDMRKHIAQSRVRRQNAAVIAIVIPADEVVTRCGSHAFKGVEVGKRLGERLLVGFLFGCLGQMPLGEILNVVVDGDGAVLLDKDRNLAVLGSGRIRIILRKHVSRGRGKCAQRHGLIVGGNSHALGAARHHLTGGLIHKHDLEGRLLGFGFLLAVDGVEVGVHPALVIPRTLINQVFDGLESERPRIRSQVVVQPALDLLVSVHGGGGHSLIGLKLQIRIFFNRSALIIGKSDIDQIMLRLRHGTAAFVGNYYAVTLLVGGVVERVSVVGKRHRLLIHGCGVKDIPFLRGERDRIICIYRRSEVSGPTITSGEITTGCGTINNSDIDGIERRGGRDSLHLPAASDCHILGRHRKLAAADRNTIGYCPAAERVLIAVGSFHVTLPILGIHSHLIAGLIPYGGGLVVIGSRTAPVICHCIGFRFGLGFSLIMAQIDIDPSVVNHPHIQLVAAYKNRVKFTAAKECSIDLDSPDIVRRHLIVPAVISRHRDLQIADSKPGTIVNPLIGIYALHNADCAVVVGVSLHSVASDQRHTVNLDSRNICVKGIRYFFPYIVVFVMDAGMGSAAGIDLSGINVNVLADNGVFGKLLAGAIVAVQLPADKDIVSAERGGAGHLIGQRGIIRYIDGVVKRPSSRFSADFQIEVYLVAGWLLFALVSQSKGSIFCAESSASTVDLKIVFAKHSPYSFCRGTYSLCKSNSDSPNRIWIDSVGRYIGSEPISPNQINTCRITVPKLIIVHIIYKDSLDIDRAFFGYTCPRKCGGSPFVAIHEAYDICIPRRERGNGQQGEDHT